MEDDKIIVRIFLNPTPEPQSKLYKKTFGQTLFETEGLHFKFFMAVSYDFS